jgi:hypothetical protein
VGNRYGVSVSSCGLLALTLASGEGDGSRHNPGAKSRSSSPINRRLLLAVCVLNSVNQSPSNLRPKAESQRRLNSHRRTWFEGAHCLSKLVDIADPNGAVRDGGTDFAAR